MSEVECEHQMGCNYSFDTERAGGNTFDIILTSSSKCVTKRMNRMRTMNTQTDERRASIEPIMNRLRAITPNKHCCLITTTRRRSR